MYIASVLSDAILKVPSAALSVVADYASQTLDRVVRRHQFIACTAGFLVILRYDHV